MATPAAIAISNTYDGESLVIEFVLNQSGTSTPVPNAADFIVSAVFSVSAGGDAMGATKYDFDLSDAEAALFRLELTDADCAETLAPGGVLLPENTPRFMAIWAKETGVTDPVLKAQGTVTRGQSIRLPSA